MPHLAIGFFFLRRNYYKIAKVKVRYFPGEKVYIQAFWITSWIFNTPLLIVSFTIN